MTVDWYLHPIAVVGLAAEALALCTYLVRRTVALPEAAAELEEATEDTPKGTPAEAEVLTSTAGKEKANRSFQKISSYNLFLYAGLLISALALYAYLTFFRNTVFLEALMHAAMMIWLAAIGWIDARERVIPNAMILCAVAFWAVLTLVEIYVGKVPARQVLLFSLLGGGITGVVLFVLALLMKTGLGMGDVKLFAVLGLFYGLTGIYSILICSLLAMALVSIILLIGKKATMKSSLPMAPFAMIGFIVTVLFGM